MNKRKKKARELACFKHENSVPSPFFLPPPPERRGEKGWTGMGKSERRRLILKEFQLKTNMTTVLNSQILKHMDKKMAKIW